MIIKKVNITIQLERDQFFRMATHKEEPFTKRKGEVFTPFEKKGKEVTGAHYVGVKLSEYTLLFWFHTEAWTGEKGYHQAVERIYDLINQY